MATAATAPAPLAGFDDLLSSESNDIQFRQVQAWGKSYGLLSTTAGEVLEWLEDKQQPGKAKDASLRLLARSFVDSSHRRLCDDREKEERMVESLRLKDSKTVNKLLNVVIELNGIATDTAAVAKND